jgi:hypothetical protein
MCLRTEDFECPTETSLGAAKRLEGPLYLGFFMIKWRAVTLRGAEFHGEVAYLAAYFPTHFFLADRNP